MELVKNERCHREQAKGERGDLMKSIGYGRLPRPFGARNDKRCIKFP
jgi:hypothetical protein